MTNTKTIPVEYRGMPFDVTIAYDVDDPAEYEHLSIKPRDDGADFLAFLQQQNSWPALDRTIANAWDETVVVRWYEDAMDTVHAEIEQGDGNAR